MNRIQGSSDFTLYRKIPYYSVVKDRILQPKADARAGAKISSPVANTQLIDEYSLG